MSLLLTLFIFITYQLQRITSTVIKNCEIFLFFIFISRFIFGIVWRKTSSTISLVIIVEELSMEHLEYESIGGLTIEDKIH